MEYSGYKNLHYGTARLEARLTTQTDIIIRVNIKIIDDVSSKDAMSLGTQEDCTRYLYHIVVGSTIADLAATASQLGVLRFPLTNHEGLK